MISVSGDGKTMNEELWHDKNAKFEIRPYVYANTVKKEKTIALELSGDYFSAFTNMSYESARDLAQWILDVTNKNDSDEEL